MATTTDDGVLRSGEALRYTALKHVSWPAVLAGVAVALTVQILLSMLGTGIGMSTIDPLQGDVPSLKTFTLGAGLWWVVSFFVSLAAGGIVAGELAGFTTRMDGALHGLITWATATLIGVYLVGNVVSSALSGAGHLASSAVSGAALGAVSSASGSNDTDTSSNINWGKLQQEVQGLLAQAANTTPQSADSTENNAAPAPGSESTDVYNKVQTLLKKGNQATPEERGAVVDLIARNSGLSQQEAGERLSAWEKTYNDARIVGDRASQQATQVADKTADVVAQLSLWSFLAFLLGALAASLGGIAGSKWRAHYLQQTRVTV